MVSSSLCRRMSLEWLKAVPKITVILFVSDYLLQYFALDFPAFLGKTLGKKKKENYFICMSYIITGSPNS